MLTTAIIVSTLAVLIGACLQASVGVGLGILAAPILALLWPGAVPGPMLTCAFVLSILVVIRDRRELDMRGATIALLGRLPGTVIAVGLLMVLSGSAWLDVLLGCILTLCVVLAAAKGRVEVEPRRAMVFAAGLLSGISGTAAGVGGPPVALVWSRMKPEKLRSTLGGYFLVGTGTSALVLLVAGEFGSASALGWLLPATVLGFVFSSKVSKRINREVAYRSVLVLSAVSSVTLLVRGIVSLVR